METKVLKLRDLKFDGPEGSFAAVFCTMNVVDKQGDMILPGAFGEQRVIISAYGHGSWGEGVNALPVGKGRIYEKGNDALVEGQFLLETTAGRETYLTIKGIADLQEFSFSLPDIEFEMQTQDGETVRLLKKIRVNEVSPVLMGAGVNTRLLEIKSGKPIQLVDHLELVASDVRNVIDRLKDVSDLRAAEGRRPGVETMKRAALVKQTLGELSIEIGRLEAVASDEPKADENCNAMLAELTRFTLLSTARR